jgi:hypothetical protein
VSGNWQFGYGTHFDEAKLKLLSVGSVYSEPAGGLSPWRGAIRIYSVPLK